MTWADIVMGRNDPEPWNTGDGGVRFHMEWLVYDKVKLENFSFVWQMRSNFVQINVTNNDAIRIMTKYVFLSKLPDKKHLKAL